MSANEPFYFFTRQNLTYLTGKKAKNLKELLDGIKDAPSSSIYYHTHHYLQRHEFLSPEPPNDYAYWVNNVFQDEILAERLASMDLRTFKRLRDIRSRLIEIIQDVINGDEFTDRNVPKGMEFHFMKAQTFIFPTKIIAKNLKEFKESLSKVSLNSIYFHMFESRLRLESDLCDFSIWLRDSLGEAQLAKEFSSLDPYTHTLERLRSKIITLITKRIKEDANDKN
jgi:hypothetical protein